MTFALQSDFLTSVKTAKLAHYTKAVSGGVLHVIMSGGDDPAIAFAPTTSTAGLTTVAAGVNTSISTAGAGTLTTAGLLGGLITRTGPTADYTDTTETAANIQAAWSTGASGAEIIVHHKNDVGFTCTLAAGSGVTLAGITKVPPNSTLAMQMRWTGSNTITITGFAVSPNDSMPNELVTTLNATAGTLAAGKVSGARSVTMISSNATPGSQALRTVAQMLTDIPNAKVGTTWRVRIANSGAGTLTLATDASTQWTMSGTMTVAQNTFRDFVFSITGATAGTVTSVGVGTY